MLSVSVFVIVKVIYVGSLSLVKAFSFFCLCRRIK